MYLKFDGNSHTQQLLRAAKLAVRSALCALNIGISRRQWLASLTICTMLWPVFSLPAAAASISRPDSPTAAEAVNEKLPLWTEAWRTLNSRIETLTTPYRPGNFEYSAKEDARRLARAAVLSGESESAETSDDKILEANSRRDDAAETTVAAPKTETGPPAQFKASAAPVAPMMNQLPADEIDSLYEYENNPGAPRGQVEMDARNPAAALPIVHRAGIANFSFGIPLASLPGRGIDAGAGMTYNSRSWNRSCTAVGTNGECTNYHYTYDVEQSWIAPGFSAGFGSLESVAFPTGSYDLYKVWPDGITDANGTRHRFICTAFSGGSDPACTEFRTNDGTFIRTGGAAVIQGLGGYANTTFTATYPNGSKVYYAGAFGTGTNRRHYPVVIQDSNGNRIRIAYKSNQSGRIDSITDTLNRKIKFYYENDATGNPDKLVAVTIPGRGESEEIQTVRFYYDTISLDPVGKFVGDVTPSSTTSVRVLSGVFMPATKTSFKYEYSSNYGMIRKITRYVGTTASTTLLTSTGSISSDGLFAASTEYDYPDGTTALTNVPKYYNRTDDWQGRTGLTQETRYDSNDPQSGGDYVSTVTTADDGFDVATKTISGSDGMLKETSITKIPVSGASKLMSKSVYTWSTDNNRNLKRIETTNEAGLTKATEFEYDQYNNQTKARDCGYAAPGTACTDATALRRTETEYETGSGWIGANILGLAKSVKTIAGSETVSKTLVEYDHGGNDSTLTRYSDIEPATHDIYYNPLAQPAGPQTVCPNGEFFNQGENAVQSEEGGCVVIYHEGYDAASAYRGNVTKVTRFSNAALATDADADVNEYNYDIAGNTVSATLSCCQLKTIGYGLTFAETGYAYPVKETKGTSPQLVVEAGYNKNTGLLDWAKDENGQTTSYEYEADTLRPKKTTFANGGYVMTDYSDKLVTATNDLVPGFVRQTTTLEANKFVESYSYFDARGLGLRSATQTPDGWSVSAAEYDNLGRMRKSYNPFYGTTPTAAVPTGTKYTETTVIDAFGRATEVTLQDGTKVYTYPNESTVTYTAPNNQSITGIVSRVKDQAGKERRQIADSLGRIVRVDEPDASGSLGAVDASLPEQQTHYEYDGNDNLSKVIQSDGTVTQERKFKYDSLSRLVAEKQVEANATLDDAGVKQTSGGLWTKVLKYDIHGLLTDGYDARGVRTHLTYDGLNRIESVTYSGEAGSQTPSVAYTYDQARAGFYNARALTKVETAASGDAPSTKTEFDYDKMGRVVKHRQWIGAQEYDLEYGYNLAGQLTSEKYPSGRVVANSYDANGRLASIADGSRTYLSGLVYQGNGNSLSSITLGNATTQSFALNDRMQMTQQELKRGTEVLQKYVYGYGQIDGSGALDTTKNNGQLGNIESYIGANKQWTQKFQYDSIGRLKQSEELRGDTDALTYRQTFDFDRFGNMYRKTASNPVAGQANPLPYTPIEEATTPGTGDIDKSTNRFRTETTYDDAGNVITDNKFRDMAFAYDANGRMVKATKASTPDALSVYDASGLRVAERVNDIWRFQIYDIGGKCVAEYGGAQSTDDGGVKYVLSDWQGSTRAILNNAGFIIARTDYTAYGENIGGGVGLRTTSQGFGAPDTLRNKYALTQRDDATGLDHTWFRKNENQAGRWTSPDPYNGSMNVGNPQSFNRYSYVESEPTNLVDPSGLNVVVFVHYSGCVVSEGRDGRPIYTCSDVSYTVFDYGSGISNTGGSDIDVGGGMNASSARSNDPCDGILAAVKKALYRVAKRARELEQDVLDLVPRGIRTAQDLENYIGTINSSTNVSEIRRQGTVESHEDSFRQSRNQLNKALKKFDNNDCGDKGYNLPDYTRDFAASGPPVRTRPFQGQPRAHFQAPNEALVLIIVAGIALYVVVSEGSRVGFPARNFVPVW